MERFPVSQAPESLEDRIRRMALSNSAGQADLSPDSRPIVRLPSTTQYASQRPDPLSTIPPQEQEQYVKNQADVVFSNQQFIEPTEHQQNPPYLPPHRAVGHSDQHVQQAYRREVANPLEYRASNPYFQGQSIPARDISIAAGQPSSLRGRGGKRHGYHQNVRMDPDAYQRVSHNPNDFVQMRQPQALYDPTQPRFPDRPHWRDNRAKQSQYLDNIAMTEVPLIEMGDAERSEKESFRRTLEAICHEVCNANPERVPRVALECFGSFQSGFASAGSDMDLVIVVKGKESKSACFSLMADDLPRALEQRLLRKGFGARLLTRARVPIIKVCQSPSTSLLDKLRQERENWDYLPNEKKYPHLYPEENGAEDVNPLGEQSNDQEADTVVATAHEEGDEAIGSRTTTTADKTQQVETSEPDKGLGQTTIANLTANDSQQARSKTWARERRAGPLDFPKTGVGIQSDINFFNPLGLHNTQLLRCYSLCDCRVRPMVLFVKAWAKRRQINSSYSGTLSSYGYVLMVLHYLINVVRPPVLPNLQHPWRPNVNCTPQGASKQEIEGWTVDFWRNEAEIAHAGQIGQLTRNRESVGSLLAGFFQYYSSLGGGYQFRWTTQILSLRSPQGILTKEEKGWVKATMEQGEGKRIQHRYLFCIEDPFELSHNVARTVTHHGIVAIRDEFRRAFNILSAVANGTPSHMGDLLDKLVEQPMTPELPADLREKPAEGQKAAYSPVQIAYSPPTNKPQPPRPINLRPQSAVKKPANGGQDVRAKPKALDVTDSDAFPTLGTAKLKARNKPGQPSSDGEISGERAKALLYEIQQKKKAQVQADAAAANAANSTSDGVAQGK